MSPRHKTLEATIAWSYDLLSEAERTLWRMASIFSGSFDLEAAERVCATDAIPKGLILDLIDGLVVKSILVGDSGGPRTRYRMLDTLREYGQRRHPDPSERGAARRRHRACTARSQRGRTGWDHTRCNGSTRFGLNI